jgi:hypothetical protein
MRVLSEQKALDRLKKLKDDLQTEIARTYEHRAKSCVTCETQGACCLDAHFVNVHISRLEAAAIRNVLAALPEEKEIEIQRRIDDSIERYRLSTDGDTHSQTFACPLFVKGTGCLVHADGKPLPCITHACYENAHDLPPDEILSEQERLVDGLDRRTYGRSDRWLPLPIALRRNR